MEGKANNSAHTRDASFSSYISGAEGNFVLKLAGSVQTPPPAMTLSRKTEEGEISVFGAERYFNMMLEDEGPRIVDYNTSKHGHNKKENRTGQHYKQPKSRPGTPSTCSEASWNSQSALLPSLRNSSHNKKKKVNGKIKSFSIFSCNGCSDKKAIYIHEINAGHGGHHGKDARKQSVRIDQNPVKQSQPRFKERDELHYSSFQTSHKEEHFAFTNLNSSAQKSAAKSQLGEKKTKEEEEPRKSLEVFGSHMMKGDIVAINLERRLSMLSWDAIPKAPSLSNASVTGPVINEDVESDASSDLFEIENLPGSGQTPFTSHASDGMSVASAAQYESSETGMEWSVVTASDEKKLAANGRTPDPTTTGTAGVAQRLESSMEKGKVTV